MTSALKKLTEAEDLNTEESSPFKREYAEPGANITGRGRAKSIYPV